MKRSDVNRIMREADKFIRSFGYIMPPFAYWSPSEFKARKDEAQAIIDAQSGLGHHRLRARQVRRRPGLFLFTVRNGNNADLSQGPRHALRRKGDDLAARTSTRRCTATT